MIDLLARSRMLGILEMPETAKITWKCHYCHQNIKCYSHSLVNDLSHSSHVGYIFNNCIARSIICIDLEAVNTHSALVILIVFHVSAPFHYRH